VAKVMPEVAGIYDRFRNAEFRDDINYYAQTVLDEIDYVKAELPFSLWRAFQIELRKDAYDGLKEAILVGKDSRYIPFFLCVINHLKEE